MDTDDLEFIAIVSSYVLTALLVIGGAWLIIDMVL